ncbi:ABC transporter permease [Rheinheimera sp. 4Y26]|uniref:ABC transporter permease n=1 Tax=Rheinheimera sp. 4Y26 TaxID=2977811 RepID=UPI0021B0936B|nr:ABC transporter permease [Rheinheimera sp. 4Y26]MCT6700428.1 ABC transporter permease [Rheinheimera sp. 4Y26]
MTNFPAFVSHCALLARFELYRLVGSPRGWFALGAFSVIWYFLLRYPIFEASVQLQQPEVQGMLGRVFGMVGLHNLLNWPLPELSVYWLITLLLLPLVAVLTSADQTASDRSRGTLRFLTLRTSRSAIVLGRFAGQMLVQALLVLLSLLATLVLAGWRLGSLPLAAFEHALIVWINLLIVLAPFTALMALCSALVRSSKLAISLAIVGSGLLMGLLSTLIWYWPDFLWLLEYLPGAQLPLLLGEQGWNTLQYAGLPLAQTAVLLTLAWLVMKGKAL